MCVFVLLFLVLSFIGSYSISISLHDNTFCFVFTYSHYAMRFVNDIGFETGSNFLASVICTMYVHCEFPQ